MAGEIDRPKPDESGVPDDFPFQPKDPAELGWEPRPKIDVRYLQSLGHVAGNPFYKKEASGGGS